MFRDIGITPKGISPPPPSLTQECISGGAMANGYISGAEIKEIQEFEEEFDLSLLEDVLDIISESAREL